MANEKQVTFSELNPTIIRSPNANINHDNKCGKTEITQAEANVNASNFCKFKRARKASKCEENKAILKSGNNGKETRQASCGSDDVIPPRSLSIERTDDLDDDNVFTETGTQPTNTGGCAKLDATVQTYFKQGYLKPLYQPYSPETKRRCASEPSDEGKSSQSYQMERKQKIWTKWQRLAGWAHHHRHQISASGRPQFHEKDIHPVISRRKRVSIQKGISKCKNHLDAYLSFMYYVCISTRDLDGKQGKSQKQPHGFQKNSIWFWMFSTFAIAHSVNLLKYSTIEFMGKGKMHDYIHLAFLLICCIIRIYSLILHGLRHDKIKDMSTKLKEATLSASVTITQPILFTVYFLAGSSLAMALVCSLYENRALREWSYNNMFLGQAYNVGSTLLSWPSANVTAEVGTLIGNGETWKTGIREFILAFCGNLEDFVLGDLMLISAIALFSNFDKYENGIKSTKTHTVTYPEFKEKWEDYQILARATETLYETGGTLPTMYHIYNLLQFAAFLRLILIKQTAYFVFVATGLNVVKSLATYWITGKTTERNKALRAWVRECAFHSLTRKRQKNRKLYMKAILIMDKMHDNPVGLGRERLFINKGLLLTFFGLGASLFGMLTEFAEEFDNFCMEYSSC